MDRDVMVIYTGFIVIFMGFYGVVDGNGYDYPLEFADFFLEK